MLDSFILAFGPVIEMLAGKYGALCQVLMIMAMARLIMKPLMTALDQIVMITPSQKDNEFLKKLLENPIYKGVVFVLDWALSLKLPKK